MSVRLRESGATLAFAHPSQLVPALVVFGDLIDPEYPFLAAVAKPEQPAPAQGPIPANVQSAYESLKLWRAFVVGTDMRVKFKAKVTDLSTMYMRVVIQTKGGADQKGEVRADTQPASEPLCSEECGGDSDQNDDQSTGANRSEVGQR